MREQAVRESQRHGRIVRPLARLEPERTAAGHVCVPRIAVAGTELQGGAHSITYSKPKKASQSAVSRFLWNWQRLRSCPLLSYIGCLRRSFDGAGPRRTNTIDGFFRFDALLDQESSSDHSGAAQAATAVNNDRKAIA
jgi:hypothetical protein